jgi:hypothetical protein
VAGKEGGAVAEDKLQDPDLPAGAIVATHEDDDALAAGQVRRNDGVVLNPAAKNPWYVLASIAGEFETTGPVDPDDDLTARNRRFWNGWACAQVDDVERVALAEDLGVPVQELSPLTEAERQTLAAEFARRLGPDVPIPAPTEEIDCRETHFSFTAVWRKCAFPEWAAFDSATFSGSADFQSATFGGSADFLSATFSGPAGFQSATFEAKVDFRAATVSGPAAFLAATFKSNVDFRAATFNEIAAFGSATFGRLAAFWSATFSGWADFRSANFSGFADLKSATFDSRAVFSSATFSGWADFQSATFSEVADFSDGTFGARTVFKDTRFRSRVPEFYHCALHQDTSLTTAESHWPEITPEIAEEGKRAYTRLRQLMLQLDKPDDAHFFFRQEMRCKEFEEDHWWNRVPITLYRWLSDYGYSVARPAAGLALAWLVPGFAYLFHFAAGIVAGTAPVSVLGPFGLSFANLFAFLGLHRLYFADVLTGLPGGLQALAGGQTVAGVVLLFFLGLGLRNRFRLH